jgi:hypothetical protein
MVDPATHHLKEWHTSGAVAATYDVAGNQLRWTTTDPDGYKSRWSTGAWDALGAMHSLTTSNGSTTYYIYGADDERLATVIRTASTNQSTTRWTLRGLGRELLRTYMDTNGSFAWTEDNIFRGAYASGMNAVFRSIGRAAGNPRLTGALRTFGDKATPALAVFAVSTLSYNASIMAQCQAGVLQ